MITDPLEILNRKNTESTTAKICLGCDAQVQLRTTRNGDRVILEPYRHPDGEYTITAELTAVPTDGPFGYRKHKCTGDE